MDANQSESGLYTPWSCCDRTKFTYRKPTESEGDQHGAARNWYQHDIDQIIYSTAFRKMQRKSQLLSPLDPRRRTRLIHTLEVVRIAREISHRLGLEESLTEAIALGHDLANSPYGAVGNKKLRQLSSGQDESGNTLVTFEHEAAGALMVETLAAHKIDASDGEFSKSRAQYLLDKGDPVWVWPDVPFGIRIGLLRRGGERCYYDYPVTPEVLDGIRNHKAQEDDEAGRYGKAGTLEGQVVWAADNFAYISQDIDDLLATGLLHEADLGKRAEHREYLLGKNEPRLWSDINRWDVGSAPDARRLFSPNSGVRIGTMIERYVRYNTLRLRANRKQITRSAILAQDIPRLYIDPGMRLVIDYIWTEITEPMHQVPRIRRAADIQAHELEQVFHILEEGSLGKPNWFLERFTESLEGSRFGKYSKAWKTCYLIAHLSWDEVEMILARFQQRDPSFDVDVTGDAAYEKAR